MRCEICRRGIEQGVSLHRQNPKGEKGVWRCADCNFKQVDPGVKLILDALKKREASR